MKMYYVYLLANKRNGTLYVGNTNDLIRRVWQHKNGLADGFTKKYGVKMLVWFDSSENVLSVITREKQIKKWNRKWKLELIEKTNPEWKDLYDGLFAERAEPPFQSNDESFHSHASGNPGEETQ